MARIHPTALVDPRRELGNDVEVGAYAVIGAGVASRRGHAGRRALRDRRPDDHRPRQPHLPVLPRSAAPPQDKKYAGEPTRLRDRRRQHDPRVLHASTAARCRTTGVTRVGNDNWIMAYVHIAHDCRSATTPSWPTTAHAGRPRAASATGRSSAGCPACTSSARRRARDDRLPDAPVSQDLPPFVMASGNPAEAQGINSEGLRRRGFDARSASTSSSRCTAAVPAQPDAGRSGASRSMALRTARRCECRRHRVAARLPGRGQPWHRALRRRSWPWWPARPRATCSRAAARRLAAALGRPALRRHRRAEDARAGLRRLVAARQAGGARLRRGAAPLPRDRGHATRAGRAAAGRAAERVRRHRRAGLQPRTGSTPEGGRHQDGPFRLSVDLGLARRPRQHARAQRRPCAVPVPLRARTAAACRASRPATSAIRWPT